MSSSAGVAVQTTPAQKLIDARRTAVKLFHTIEQQGIAAAGKTEKQVDKEVFELGASEFGTRRHWHERIIRSGENAMHPLYIKRPDATLREDDIYFVDLGPVFYKIEADFGRTYVIGDDKEKHRLASTLPVVFKACKDYYLSNPTITGAEFFEFVKRTSEKHGYRYANGAYCAHLIGDIPLHGDYRHDKVNLACPENHTPMNAPDKDGAPRHWVLEIHLLQNPKVGRYGGFHEDLLNIKF